MPSIEQNRVDGHSLARRWETCRVCGGPIRTVFDLGPQFLQGAFVKRGKPQPPRVRFPLELTRCTVPECGLTQLRHSTPAELMYRTYWYRSRINKTMRDHFAWITRTAVEIAGRPPRRVLDIGCNDGSLLLQFAPADRWGVDPSDAAGEASDQLNIIHDFFPTEHDALLPESFDVVTSIAMFYDVDNPVEFAKHVAALLAPGGIWVVEVGYLPTMLRNGGYDAICHEHLAYYSLGTLGRVFREAGLEIVAAELTDINGGSLCCFVSHASAEGLSVDTASVDRIRARERSLGLDTEAPFADFAAHANTHRTRLRELLHRLRGEGKVVHVYGASTKGNTLLQFCGIDRTVISFAAERNPDKVGARTLGSDIDIISEEESRDLAPDYYLVLPWHFRDEIISREADTIRAGRGLIFPLPELEIIR